MDFQAGAENEAFPSTRVSLVALARTPGRPGFQEAWESFFRGYWGPLYRYLVRTGSTRDDALDLLQEFFVEGVHGSILKGYDQERGRLRTYLLACLRNVRRKAFRREGRRPDRHTYAFVGADSSEDAFALPEPAARDPEEAFEREWVRVLCQRTVDDVRERLLAAGDPLSVALLDRWVLVSDRPPAGELAAELGLSPGNLYTRATRLRAVLVREAESQARVYTGSESELAEERDAVIRMIRDGAEASQP